MNPPDAFIDGQLVSRGIHDQSVLDAMRTIDRSLFVPEHLKSSAYNDSPLPISCGQTISQPYIVALMAQALALQPSDKVLEIGTGCGYHAAVVSRLVKKVFSIEIFEELAEIAVESLQRAHIRNVEVRAGDGYRGWPEEAPFDAIYLTAAPRSVPQPLKDQLKVGGRLLAPVGSLPQKLELMFKKRDGSFTMKQLAVVSFVPMTGDAERD